jgi:energy-converting hydrogenase Eha subunit F
MHHMRLNAPTKMVFVISLILAVLALIGYFVPAVPYLHAYEFWIAIAAYVVLAAACLLKGV